jgi:transposase InsO family protein
MAVGERPSRLFASFSIARLSRLSVWWIRSGILPELIEPGCPQQNGRHERMHRTLKQATVIPPAKNIKSQQKRFNHFVQEYNFKRPHQGKDVRIASYHPQSNGIDERFHRTLREEGLAYYGNLIEAKRQVGKWIEHYNHVRLHSSIDYMPPAIWHNGDPNILAEERKQKVLKAKQERE